MGVFDKIIPFVIAEEGGYVNNPKDPGGETKYGISKRSYPHLNIKDLTLPDAVAIYKKDYWENLWERYGFPLAACMLDTAVNMGKSRAYQFLANCDKDFVRYIQLRKERYRELIRKNPDLAIFEKGWMNRLTRLRQYIDANNTGNFIYNGNRKDIT
jgi:lysozyme family protein